MRRRSPTATWQPARVRTAVSEIRDPTFGERGGQKREWVSERTKQAQELRQYGTSVSHSISAIQSSAQQQAEV